MNYLTNPCVSNLDNNKELIIFQIFSTIIINELMLTLNLVNFLKKKIKNYSKITRKNQKHQHITKIKLHTSFSQFLSQQLKLIL